MAFPTTISTAHRADAGGQFPYLSSGGNVYVIMWDGTTQSKIQARKATDPTVSFSAVGTDPTVTSGNSIQCMDTYQVGDVIHVVTVDGASAASVDIRYHAFDMSSDTWTTTNEAVRTGFATVSVFWMAFALRSNGDIIVLYNGPKVANMGSDRERVYYARKVSGAWTTDVAVDNGGATDWMVGDVVVGASDRMHFFFQDAGSDDMYQRCLTSANALEAFPASFDATSDATAARLVQSGDSYVSGGTTKVRYPYADSTANTLNSGKCDSADAPTMSVDSDISGSTNFSGALGGNWIASMSANGTTLYAFYVDSNSDIFYSTNADGAGWPASGTSFYAGTVTKLYTNIYTRNGDIVAGIVFYETNPKYHELLITAGDTSLFTLCQDMQFLPRGWR